ncbi:MAG TPA: ABC transporter permease subunit [Candidatus Limnocylindrales bacterium]|nr:ABC transporter permease subunit [Candidatus Limnocylindrales bacterium]
MNRALFGHTWRANRLRLVIVTASLAVWGTLLPIVFDAFGEQFQGLFESGTFPSQFSQFGGGDIFSLSGAVALGFVHPIAVGLVLVFAIGFASTAVAGERQRGTLEVLLSRPLSRRVVYATLALAGALFIGISVAGLTVGSWLGAALTGRTAELGAGNLPLLWLNGALLYWAFGAIGLLASVSFDRLSPAISLTLAVVLVSYFFEILGSLWPDARGLQPFSLFHYVDPKSVLAGFPRSGDFAVLAGVTLAAVVGALVVFPRRDLAAPS